MSNIYQALKITLIEFHVLWHVLTPLLLIKNKRVSFCNYSHFTGWGNQGTERVSMSFILAIKEVKFNTPQGALKSTKAKLNSHTSVLSRGASSDLTSWYREVSHLAVLTEISSLSLNETSWDSSSHCPLATYYTLDILSREAWFFSFTYQNLYYDTYFHNQFHTFCLHSWARTSSRAETRCSPLDPGSSSVSVT